MNSLKTGVKSLITICLICMSLQSCYVVGQAGPFLSHRMSAVPIETILAQEDISSDVRDFLIEVQKIRSYGINELGLIPGKNYTKYVIVDSDYLAAVIQAAPEFSTDPYLFWYPFMGRLPYRGYYNSKDAIAYGKKLEKKGLDVFIRPVDAFSSLGFFKDPLFSFMTDYPLDRIAELIIHEETHSTVFFKKYPDFNEKLATFVGTKGAELYLRYSGRSELLSQMEESQQRNDAFKKDIFELSNTLELLYSSGKPSGSMLAEKKRLLSGFKEKWKLPYEINNAYVSLYKLYEEPDNRIAALYDRLGSIPALLEFFKEVQNMKGNPWEALEEENQLNAAIEKERVEY